MSQENSQNNPQDKPSNSPNAQSGFISRNLFWIVAIVIVASVAFVVPTFSHWARGSAGPVGGPPNEALWLDAAAKAKETGRPILVDFTADWCPPCQVMKKNVFPQPRVINVLKDKYVFVTADVTSANSSGTPLGNRYQVTAIPTMMILDPQGNIIDQRVGGMNTEQFASWLEAAAAAYAKNHAPGQTPDAS